MSPARCPQCSGLVSAHPDGTTARCGWCGKGQTPTARDLEQLMGDTCALAMGVHGELASVDVRRVPEGWVLNVCEDTPEGITSHEWTVGLTLLEAVRSLEGVLLIERAHQQRRAVLTLVPPANDASPPASA